MNTVLYVDDDATFRMLFRRLLPATLALEFAGRGDEALRMIQAATIPFAVIVTDMWLPGMDGMQLLTLVRSCSPLTTRVILTGDPQVSSHPSVATEAAPFRLLFKPVSLVDLLGTVNDAVAHHRQLISMEIAAAA